MELNYQPSEVLVTVGGSEEKIHELFYQPEALELYRNGMKSVDEMKALIRYMTSSWTEHKSVDESKELLDKLKQYIDEHLESELRRDELAEYVHLNPDYLTRLWQSQAGGPAAHYQAAHGRVLFRSRVPAHWRSIERTDRGKVWIYGRDLPTVHHQL